MERDSNLLVNNKDTENTPSSLFKVPCSLWSEGCSFTENDRRYAHFLGNFLIICECP